MKAYFKAIDKRENKKRLISTGDEDYKSSYEEAVEDVKNVLSDVQYMKLISPILTVINGGKTD